MQGITVEKVAGVNRKKERTNGEKKLRSAGSFLSPQVPNYLYIKFQRHAH